MDLLKTVLKVENHNKEPLNIRGIFARCGEIPSLYPYDAGVPGASLYFMKFTNIENAERAIGLELGGVGIRVYPISANPQFIKQYRATNPSDFDSYGRPRRTSTTNVHKDTLAKLNRDPTPQRRGSTSVARAQASGIMPNYFLEFSRDRNLSNAASFTSPPVTPMQGSSKSIETGGGDARVTPRQPRSSIPLLTPVINVEDDLSIRMPTVVVSSIDAAPSISAFSPSFSNTITMRLCGGAITFDLQELQQNPQVIIDLLKLTQSERGNWMVVAANYRRSSNTSAAISVLDAMTTELMKRGVSEQDIKPAFLMLSGCEVDLAKKAKKKKDTAAASVHYRAAQKWLQRVFGEGAPPPETLARLQPFNAAPSQTTPTTATDCSRLSSKPIPTSPSPSRLKVPICVLPITPGTPSIATPTKPFAAIHTKPGNSISLSQHRILERELQSLRDRNNDQALLLSEVRNVKRKLEEDNEHERNLRRKLQRKLDELEKERDDARRLETYALDQIKREVNIRRKAEERAEKEHELRMELVKATAERNIDTKVVFEDLGNTHNAKAGHIGNENTPPDAGA